jgi:hypothetical protein
MAVNSTLWAGRSVGIRARPCRVGSLSIGVVFGYTAEAVQTQDFATDPVYCACVMSMTQAFK